MIIQFIIKNIKTILEIVVIVAFLVWFSFWDPWGWFNPEPKLENTAITVKSIKEIGELVTAEYYGEAFASLKESKIDTFSNEYLAEEAYWLYDSIKSKVENYTINKRRKLHKNTILPSEFLYDPLVYYLSEEYIIANYSGNNRTSRLKELYKKDFIDIERKCIKEYISSDYEFSKFPQFYKDWLKKKLDGNRKERKKELIMLGRGKVTAGINFKEFSKDNFSYDKKNGIIVFKNVKPEILSCDINPWFIPERKVKGYEIVKITGQVTDPADVLLVKKECIRKLKEQAMNLKILETAKKNAESSLKSFFSVLTGDEIKEVIFSFNKYDYYIDEFYADSVISLEEFNIINNTVNKDVIGIDTNWYQDMQKQLSDLKSFISTIKKDSVKIENNRYILIAKYSPLIGSIIKSGIFNTADYNNLNQLYNKEIEEGFTKVDTIWYNSSQDKVKSLRKSLNIIQNNIDSIAPEVNNLFSKEDTIRWLLYKPD